MNKIRKHYIFYGGVQGVGFRYTVYHTAQKYGITGWVRNCYDGSVEMEAEGTPIELEHLLIDLGNYRWAYIESIDVHEIPLENSASFRIRD